MPDEAPRQRGRPSMDVIAVGWTVYERTRESLALLAVALGTVGNESATVRQVIEDARRKHDAAEARAAKAVS